jgi:hypothetical protein
MEIQLYRMYDLWGDEVNDVPIINFHSKLNEKILEIKLRKYSNNFKQSLDHGLSLYPIDKLKYSSNLVSFVMHEAERLILKQKSGNAKDRVLLTVLKNTLMIMNKWLVL